jgi:hypothetical protein
VSVRYSEELLWAATAASVSLLLPSVCGDRLGTNVFQGRATIVNLIILIVILLIVFGGGGFYYGGPYVGGGLGTVLLIVLVVLLLRG